MFCRTLPFQEGVPYVDYNVTTGGRGCELKSGIPRECIRVAVSLPRPVFDDEVHLLYGKSPELTFGRAMLKRDVHAAWSDTVSQNVEAKMLHSPHQMKSNVSNSDMP